MTVAVTNSVEGLSSFGHCAHFTFDDLCNLLLNFSLLLLLLIFVVRNLNLNLSTQTRKLSCTGKHPKFENES